jgi:hypothetical protein
MAGQQCHEDGNRGGGDGSHRCFSFASLRGHGRRFHAPMRSRVAKRDDERGHRARCHVRDGACPSRARACRTCIHVPPPHGFSWPEIRLHGECHGLLALQIVTLRRNSRCASRSRRIVRLQFADLSRSFRRDGGPGQGRPCGALKTISVSYRSSEDRDHAPGRSLPSRSTPHTLARR